MAGVDGVQVGDEVVHDVLVGGQGAQSTLGVLQDELVLGGQVGEAVGQGGNLGALGVELLGECLDLVDGGGGIVGSGGSVAAGSGGLATDVVERVLVVGLELGVLELPGLGES